MIVLKMINLASSRISDPSVSFSLVALIILSLTSFGVTLSTCLTSEKSPNSIYRTIHNEAMLKRPQMLENSATEY